MGDVCRAPADPTRPEAFTQQPTQLGSVTTAVLDDTCGNLIQIMST